MAPTGLVYDEAYLDHDTGWHVERSNRLRAVIEEIERTGLSDRLNIIRPRLAGDGLLLFQQYCCGCPLCPGKRNGKGSGGGLGRPPRQRH